MKFQLIDQAYNIAGFDNQATELTIVLNKKVLAPLEGSNKEQEQLVLQGFKLALDMVEQYPHMIKATLLETVKAIKREYEQLTKFTRDYSEISAISLALNHIRKVNMVAHIKQRDTAYAIKQKTQHKADERMCEKLADEIRTMLTGVADKPILERKPRPRSYVSGTPIWALKIDDDTAEAFVIGHSQVEVSTKLGAHPQTISSTLTGRLKSAKGYKLWTE